MKNALKEISSYLIIIVIVLLIKSFIFTLVRVNGSSMDKTLHEGNIMILNLLDHSFEREDIIVADKSVEGSLIIKRIIGLPNEKIFCKDGIIYINDVKYDDPYANGETADFDEITLKEDEYFLLGDNRVVSLDSRYFGPVPKKAIMGSTNIIVFPFKKIGKVK
ncbi:MAG: signal peptidase I [Bacilli bacterium]|nr:signal peptidase I [Bacilli bacterium]